jgi:hypothetical protein
MQTPEYKICVNEMNGIKMNPSTYSEKRSTEESSELADSAIEFLRVAEETYNTISQKLIPDDRTMRKALFLSGLVYAALC